MAFERITPQYIIKAHLDTIRNKDTNKLYCSDIFLLFILPLIISVILIDFNILIEKEMSETLLTILAISTPLLFSALILLFDMALNILDKKLIDKDVKLHVINDTLDNISFIIFLSVIIIIILGVYLLLWNNLHINSDNIGDYKFLIQVFTFFTYSLIGMFLLNFLMILKKSHILIGSFFPHNND
ncbi:hypothetical protein KQY27_00255 [Methanobrevibacter sp. TMH8]|uniref:hypothetical protein n=1 Tax=Methanobrevibacter sp. TMH8 TaxID=2848611 RepID=UPI001CCA3030|nr:hypothetical protein [Methanobrevibacter sp. TMH8]MBZ9569990.1 hypothetical protein [Methanobrevibacter sp. TMH8]